MKSIVYACIAIMLYAIQNTIIDVKLKNNSTASLLLVFYIVLLPLAIGLFCYQKLSGQAVTIPQGNTLWIVVAVAVMFFVADFFYFGAYTSGGDVATITIILVLMPVVSALIKFLWVKDVPTPYHMIGFVFAAISVIFILIGNSKKATKLTTEEQSAITTSVSTTK